jgi:hypothetical protein
MKIAKINVFLLFLGLAILIALGGASAFAFTTPKGHESFMADEDYKNQFEAFSLVEREAKERLTPQEFQALEKKIDESLAAEVKENMESESTEAAAWSTAYIVASESIGRELVFDYLRKNPTGVQGYYKLVSEAFDGYMTVQEGDTENSYAVYISVVPNGGSAYGGEVNGHGQLAGNKIPVDFGSDDKAATVEVSFDGDKAGVVTSEGFKSGDWVEKGIVLDGEYAREKK